MECSSAFKKGNSDTCYSMVVWGHYTKQNKPVTKKDMLYNSTYLYKVYRIVSLIEIESRMVVAKSWREGKMGSCCLMGTEFQFCKLKEFWRLLAWHMNIVNTTKLYTLIWSRWKLLCFVYFAKLKIKVSQNSLLSVTTSSSIILPQELTSLLFRQVVGSCFWSPCSW